MSKFPPPPVESINWTDSAKFISTDANGHIESTYKQATGKWSALKFVADPHLRIHGLASGLNYGQQAFEGLKAFRMPGPHGGIAIFRPDAHAGRLQHSAGVLDMPAVPSGMFMQACRAAVALNAGFVPPHASGWGLYCRPLLFGSDRELAPGAGRDFTFCVFVQPIPTAGPGPVRALVLDDFDRAPPRGTGTAKAGGNYAGVFRWSRLARADGFCITLHLDSTRHECVDEFSLSGFLGVRYGGTSPPTGRIEQGRGSNEVEDVTLVMPDSPCALKSLTSDSVQQIARSWGWKVVRRPVPYTELPEFDEVIGTGTAMGLTAVQSITRRGRTSSTEKRLSRPRLRLDSDSGTETITYLPDGHEGAGPVCRRLLEQLRAIQFGEVPDEFGWRSEVKEHDLKLSDAPNGNGVNGGSVADGH